MAEIKLIAETTSLGPSLPYDLGATVQQRAWPGGGAVPILVLYFPADTLEVWPADPEILEAWADKIKACAAQIRRDA